MGFEFKYFRELKLIKKLMNDFSKNVLTFSLLRDLWCSVTKKAFSYHCGVSICTALVHAAP